MNTIKLNTTSREETGKKMRAKAGKNIPAVVYGPTMDSQKLWVNAVDMTKALANAGTNTVISLVIDDSDAINVLIHDFQLDALTDNIIHVDFYLVDMNEMVETEIPLVFTGTSQAVKNLGGTLVKNQDTIMVKALPADLPHEIEVSLDKLDTFDDHITVSDIVVADNVEIIADDANAVIAMVSAPRTDEEMAALDEEVDADVSKVEGAAEEVEEEGDESSEDNKEEKTEDK